jgi:hypothetical protein
VSFPDPPAQSRVIPREVATHVRLEERELFPIIEDAIPPDELLVLARALEQAAHNDEAG